MSGKVKIGIIGTGFARKVQIPAFQMVEGAEIVSVASGHAENAEKTAREFNIKHYTDDWRETIKQNIDLICITTPPDTHREMTLAALDRNLHVLCEKPMAMNAAEAREMTEKAAGVNVLALIDHELRFQSGRIQAKKMLDDGAIGKIINAKCNFRNASRGSLDVPWNWWSNEKQGGGALGAIGSHIIDSLRWFTGAEISSVFCQLQTHVKERRVEKSGKMREVSTDDESLMILRFADSNLTQDASGIVSVSMVEYSKYQNRIEVFGTNGALRINHSGEIHIAGKDDKDWREIAVKLDKPLEGVPDTGFSRGFTSFAPEIIKAIREGAAQIENAASFADGWRVQEVLDAARKSNETGAIIKL